jgi:hypothetical protein
MTSRFDYVAYDDEAQKAQAQFKEIFIEVDRYIDCLENGREKALAITKLEESYMWIGKAIRDEQIVRNIGTELQEERSNS